MNKIYIVRDYDKVTGYYHDKEAVEKHCFITGTRYHEYQDYFVSYYETEFFSVWDAKGYLVNHKNAAIYFVGSENDWFAGTDIEKDIRHR